MALGEPGRARRLHRGLRLAAHADELGRARCGDRARPTSRCAASAIVAQLQHVAEHHHAPRRVRRAAASVSSAALTEAGLAL